MNENNEWTYIASNGILQQKHCTDNSGCAHIPGGKRTSSKPVNVESWSAQRLYSISSQGKGSSASGSLCQKRSIAWIVRSVCEADLWASQGFAYSVVDSGEQCQSR